MGLIEIWIPAWDGPECGMEPKVAETANYCPPHAHFRRPVPSEYASEGVDVRELEEK